MPPFKCHVVSSTRIHTRTPVCNEALLLLFVAWLNFNWPKVSVCVAIASFMQSWFRKPNYGHVEIVSNVIIKTKSKIHSFTPHSTILRTWFERVLCSILCDGPIFARCISICIGDLARYNTPPYTNRMADKSGNLTLKHTQLGRL